jgi:outer membrane receptor for ferrienterochelin and colicins
MRRKAFCSLVFVFFVSSVFLACFGPTMAQAQRAIEGTIVDMATGEALWCASVSVQGTAHGATSDRNGQFFINKLPPGKYILRISFIGYQPVQLRGVVVEPGRPATIAVELEPTDLRLPKILVTAQRSTRSVKDIPAETHRISPQELDDLGLQTLTDAVRWVPGVTISGGAPNGAARRFTAMIHGLPAHYTMILVDGVRAKSEHIHTGINANLVPIQMIEQIEVVKGPASAIYGSDAFGGVVSITTKDAASEPFYGVEASYGKYNTRNVNLQHGSKVDRLVYYINFNMAQTDGVPNTDGANFDYSQANVLGKLSLQAAQSTRVTLSARSYNNTYLRKVGVPKVNDNWIDVAGRLKVGSGDARHVSGGVSFSHFKGEYRHDDNRTVKGDLLSRLPIGRRNVATVGIEVRNEQFSRDATSRRATWVTGAFVEDTIKPTASQTYSLALRLDHHPGVATEVTPSVGVLYGLTSNTDIRASVARGFRAPSLQDLYEEGFDHRSYYRDGNPDLQPEYSTNYSVGLERRFSHQLVARTSVFHSDLRNMIVVRDTGELLDGKPVFRRENVREASTFGAEVEARVRLGGLTAMLSHIYADTQDADNEPLAYSPRHMTSLRLYHHVERFEIGSMLSCESALQRYYRQKSGGRGRLEDYTLLNLSVNKKLLHRAVAFFKIENLLDQEFEIYEDGKSLAGYGRSFLGGIGFRFSVTPSG